MAKVNVSLGISYRLLHPKTVGLISVRDSKGRVNVMTAGMIMLASHEPPLLVLGISPTRYSHRMIEEAKEFVVNIPDKEIVDKVDFCGTVSGRATDKIKTCGFTLIESERVKTPSIKECVAHLECEVQNSFVTGDHTLFLARIVAARVEAQAWKNNRYDIAKAKPILEIGGNRYTYSADEILIPKPF
ncbi:MAG: flavin reductase family protein [Candidatus Bathyarchaeia archaeon]